MPPRPVGPLPAPSRARRRLACAVVGALLVTAALVALPRAVGALNAPGLFTVRPATVAESPVPSRSAETVVADPAQAAPIARVILRWALTLTAWAALAAVGMGLLAASLLACWPAVPWQAPGAAADASDPPA